MNKKENKILDKIVKMTPKAMTRLEKILFDMGVEEIKGEICSIHGDVCECSEDTKRKSWILRVMKNQKILQAASR